MRRRAEYTDAVGFSSQLWGRLSDGAGGALLCTEALSFWSEHLERAGVDSWLAAVGGGSEMRGFLGRRGASGSADSYAHTAIRIVENLQKLDGRYAREVMQGGPGPVRRGAHSSRFEDVDAVKGLQQRHHVRAARASGCS